MRDNQTDPDVISGVIYCRLDGGLPGREMDETIADPTQARPGERVPLVGCAVAPVVSASSQPYIFAYGYTYITP